MVGTSVPHWDRMQVRNFALSFYFFNMVFPDLLLILLQPAWRMPSSYPMSIPWVSTSWYTFRVSQSSPITSFSLLSYTISTLLYHQLPVEAHFIRDPHNHHTSRIQIGQQHPKIGTPIQQRQNKIMKHQRTPQTSYFQTPWSQSKSTNMNSQKMYHLHKPVTLLQ